MAARALCHNYNRRITRRWSGPRRRYTLLAVDRRACAAAAAQRHYVMRLLTAIAVGIAAMFALGFCLMVLLTLIEAMKLLFWNLRGCPRCRRLWAFPKSPVNFEFGRWRGGGLSHECEVNGHTFERPWVIATCRHCAFAVRLKKAPVFD